MSENLRFQLEGARWQMDFTRDVEHTMLNYAQTGRNSRESVGQLYTRDLTKPFVLIEYASQLRPTMAIWSRVRFDPQKALVERQTLFKEGLHCVGMWHTHPEPCPTPSREDRQLSHNYALAASAHLRGIVFVIVGTLPHPHGFRVWVDDGTELLLAQPALAPPVW